MESCLPSVHASQHPTDNTIGAMSRLRKVCERLRPLVASTGFRRPLSTHTVKNVERPEVLVLSPEIIAGPRRALVAAAGTVAGIGLGHFTATRGPDPIIN